MGASNHYRIPDCRSSFGVAKVHCSHFITEVYSVSSWQQLACNSSGISWSVGYTSMCNVQDQSMDHTYLSDLLRWIIHVTIIEKDGTPLFYRLLLTINIFLLMCIWAGQEVCTMPVSCCVWKNKWWKATLWNSAEWNSLFLLGDPLRPWLMKPFPHSGALSSHQKLYNYRICRGRVVVEIAFGRLKARWRRLSKQNDMNVGLLHTSQYLSDTWRQLQWWVAKWNKWCWSEQLLERNYYYSRKWCIYQTSISTIFFW